MAKGTLNKVLLVGRLGKDPEIRFSGEGNAIANFSIATNETWKDKEGNQQEKTHWHNIVVFGASAEKYIQPYVKKGTLVSVEGKLQTRDWNDKDGNKRYTTEVIADLYGGVQILGSGGTGDSTDSSAGMNQEPSKKENLDQTSDNDDDGLPF
ncbi:MAG: single-stranded DNA-binding protein [Candidatus Marinimicrobia bacterium]|nr:single-stranded DNA-binding protein [Candidatus Neomarinimicrobiota bacterium]|tara:strand:+ start:23667 stop:24122 length:456 start_codon:yes stop_codon:yes gene_type:complete